MLTETDSETESFVDSEEEEVLPDSLLLSNSSVDVKPSHVATAAATVTLSILFLEGFVGTMWIICSVVPRRNTWNIINVFVASLCSNDLLSLLLIVLPIIDSYAWRRWRAGTLLCRLSPQLTVALTGCSLWHSALIAVHRYLVVVHKQLYNRMSKNAYVVFVLVTTRLVPFATAFVGISPRSSGHVPKLLRCILLPGRPMRMLAVTIVQIVAPSVVVVVCYSVIFLFVLTADRKLSGPRPVSSRREIQITKMFGLIFLTILGGFVPYSVVRNLDADNSLNGDVYVIISVFYAVATCSNPIVYGAMSRDIRCACAVLLRDAAVCVCGRGERGCVAAIERFLMTTSSGSIRDAEGGGDGVERGWMMRGGITENNATFAVSSQSHHTVVRDENGTSETLPAAATREEEKDAENPKVLDVMRKQEGCNDLILGDEGGGLGNEKCEQKTVHNDDDKMVRKDDDTMARKDDDKMVLKDNDKMLQQHDNKLADKDGHKMVRKDDDKMVRKDDDKRVCKDDDKMVRKDDDKRICKVDDKMIRKDDDKMVRRDDDKTVSKDDDKMECRQDGLTGNELDAKDIQMTETGNSDDADRPEEEKQFDENQEKGNSQIGNSDKGNSETGHSDNGDSETASSYRENSDKK